MTSYPILEAADWGMRWERPPVKAEPNRPVKYVHHSAGNPFATIEAAAAFRQMNEMAIREGLSAIDYTMLVHEHPASDTVTIGIARGEWLPAATYAQNTVSRAVCALGYFHPGHALSARPSPRMLEGLARACAEMIRRGWAAPDSTTLGHRDSPGAVGSHSTSCPGDYLWPEVPWIHARALELTNQPPGGDDPVTEKEIEAIAAAVTAKVMSQDNVDKIAKRAAQFVGAGGDYSIPGVQNLPGVLKAILAKIPPA